MPARTTGYSKPRALPPASQTGWACCARAACWWQPQGRGRPVALVRNKHQIRGSHGAGRATWLTVLRLLAQSGETFRPLITHRIDLEDTVDGFELGRSKVAVKVMVTPK